MTAILRRAFFRVMAGAAAAPAVNERPPAIALTPTEWDLLAARYAGIPAVQAWLRKVEPRGAVNAAG